MRHVDSANSRSLNSVSGGGRVSMVAVQGRPGADGSNVLPTDEAIAAAIENNASDTAAALSASIDARASDPNGLPNEHPFWWNSTSIGSINGRVYAGTTDDNTGCWVQEWTQPGGDAAPFWVRRYFLGYAGAGTVMDDHLAPGLAIAEGKPLVAFWSGHSFDNVINYRATLKNIDDYADGEPLTWGDVQTFEIPGDQRTSYTIVRPYGDDIYVLHRTGNPVDRWSLTNFPAWATGTPDRVELLSSTDQFYATGRIVGDAFRIAVSDHPSIGTDNKVWYCEVDLISGDVTEADGTVLGNLDGTNLPLAEADLELIYTATGSEKPWTFDVGYGAAPEIAFVTGELTPNFASTADYMYAKYSAGAWAVNPITPVGSFLGGAYFPSIVFVPDTTGQVVLARDTGDSVDRVSRYTTANGGTSWTGTDLDTASAGNPTLTRAFCVQAIDAATPIFDVMATEIDSYPTYTNWVSRFRPLPRDAVVRRAADVNDFTLDQPETGLYLPGTSGSYILGSNVALPAGGVRLEVDVALDDWTPAATQCLIAKHASTTQRSIYLEIGTNGKMQIRWSEDGTTLLNVPTTAALGFTDGQRAEVRVDFVPAYDATHYWISFHKRLPGEERWTQIESLSPAASNTSIFASTSPWEIGSRTAGTTDLATGTFYRAGVYTIGGDVVTEWKAARGGTVTKDTAAQTWTRVGDLGNTPLYSSTYNGTKPFKRGAFTYFVDSANVERRKNGTPADGTDGYVAHTMRAVTTLTGGGSITTRDDVVIVNAGSAITATLPSASVVGAGKEYVVKCVSAAGANIGTTSSQTIDGAAAPLAIVQWEAVRLLSNGTNWLKIT
jgi:hypothetical protein